MPLEVCFQLSLFGKTSWERFHQETGWILEPSYPLSQIPRFQCLCHDDGQMPEWCEGIAPTSHGGSWTPSIGEAPSDWQDGSECLSWRILEGGALPKYFLSPGQCSGFLRLAARAGCQPPAEIEALFLKQGGEYPSSDPFSHSVCEGQQNSEIMCNSETASDYQLTLFPLC